jgi:hypothetical protein
MDTPDWATISALASACSAFGSLVTAFWYTRRTVAGQAKLAEFNNCLEIVKQLGEAQRRVWSAADVNRTTELRELFNLMEALAFLLNHGKMADATGEFTARFLEEAWAYARVDTNMRHVVSEAVTGSGTYAELSKFADARRATIDKLTETYRKTSSF